jgi:uncharacterized protein (DUF58 family)
MTGLRRWFGRETANVAAATPTSDALLNPGTWVSVSDLIGLQRHAGKIGLKRVGPARAQLAGNHASRFRGRGMDYQESRIYQAGDDIRSMDWRVTARTGTAHVKLYQEERERPVVLFLDLNPGMFFGSRGMLKSVVAARAAALLAWAAADSGDRVGAMLFNSGYCDLQPRGGQHGVLRLIRQLVEHSDPRIGVNAATHPGGLNAALSRVRRISRPGSLIVLLGDYYGIDEDSGNHLLRMRQHCDVVAIQIVDPLEEAPPPAGRYAVTAGGRQGILDTRSAAASKAYQDYFSHHHQVVATMMSRHAIPLLRLSTAADVVAVLQNHFAARFTRRRTLDRAA